MNWNHFFYVYGYVILITTSFYLAKGYVRHLLRNREDKIGLGAKILILTTSAFYSLFALIIYHIGDMKGPVK